MNNTSVGCLSRLLVLRNLNELPIIDEAHLALLKAYFPDYLALYYVSPHSKMKRKPWKLPTIQPMALLQVCGQEIYTKHKHLSKASRRGVYGPYCDSLFPSGASFGGYKDSGIGRETHHMTLDHYRHTKNVLISYDKNKLCFF